MKKCPACPTHEYEADRGSGHIAKNGEIIVCEACNGSGVVDDDGRPIARILGAEIMKYLMGKDQRGDGV